MTAKDKQYQLYKEAMGRERAERQAQLTKQTCSECGGKNGRHHQLCRRGANQQLKEQA